MFVSCHGSFSWFRSARIHHISQWSQGLGLLNSHFCAVCNCCFRLRWFRRFNQFRQFNQFNRLLQCRFYSIYRLRKFNFYFVSYGFYQWFSLLRQFLSGCFLLFYRRGGRNRDFLSWLNIINRIVGIGNMLGL